VRRAHQLWFDRADPDGSEASGSIEVPGGLLDLTLGTGSRKPAKRRG